MPHPPTRTRGSRCKHRCEHEAGYRCTDCLREFPARCFRRHRDATQAQIRLDKRHNVHSPFTVIGVGSRPARRRTAPLPPMLVPNRWLGTLWVCARSACQIQRTGSANRVYWPSGLLGASRVPRCPRHCPRASPVAVADKVLVRKTVLGQAMPIKRKATITVPPVNWKKSRRPDGYPHAKGTQPPTAPNRKGRDTTFTKNPKTYKIQLQMSCQVCTPTATKDVRKTLNGSNLSLFLPLYPRLEDVPSGEEGFEFEIGDGGRRRWV